VITALRHWPPKISGSRAGRRTNTPSSTRPTDSGRARYGRPRIRLRIAAAARRIASPPSTAATFASGDQSSWIAPSISPRKTRAKKGTARLKTSVEAW
jgi:hypothetical protein